MDDLTIWLSVVGPLVGVALGAFLSRRGSDHDWMRERRADLYIEMLDTVHAIVDMAAVPRKVLKFPDLSPVPEKYDTNQIHDAWIDLLEQWHHIMVRISVFGADVAEAFGNMSPELITVLDQAYENPDITREQYNEALFAGMSITSVLELLARYDLGSMRGIERFKFKHTLFKKARIGDFKPQWMKDAIESTGIVVK